MRARARSRALFHGARSATLAPWGFALLLGLACSRGSSGSGASGDPATSQAPSSTRAPHGASSGPSSAAANDAAASAPNAQPGPTPAALPLRAGGERVVRSDFGMVTSVEPHATRAGVRVLEAGGNAVDAAVAVGYALAVTHPSAGNVGGGGFMLIAMAGKPSRALDFREQAPAALTQAGFDAMIARRAREPSASGVPGTPAGLNAAHRAHGRLPLARVLAPAIELAESGHALGKRQAQVLGWTWPSLKRDPAARRLFAPRGEPLREGQRWVQPQLAALLRRIAEQGDAGFYQGATAEALVRYMREHQGWIDLADLQSYSARFREPLTVGYRGLDVEVMPPPSAGGVAVVQMLAMLEQVAAPPFSLDSVAGLHLFAEVAKRAHAERRFGVGDPDSVVAYDDAARRARWVDAGTWLTPFPISADRVTPAASLHPAYRAAMKELDHTTHFSVSDVDGNVVSCTTTLSGGFGAQYVIEELGLVMNNSVAAFGTVGENVPKPGRRMTSSMSPTLLRAQGRVVAALGSPGGDTIPNTVVQVLSHLVDAGLPLDRAVDAPRIHHGFVPDALRYETLRPPDERLLKGLEGLGHRFTEKRRTIGDANNLLVLEGVHYGYADAREGGLALGPAQRSDAHLPP